MSDVMFVVCVVGFLVSTVSGIMYSSDHDGVLKHPLVILCVVTAAVCAAGLIWIGNAEQKNRPVCAVHHYETRHGFMMAGKVTMPTTYQAYVCDVYESPAS